MEYRILGPLDVRRDDVPVDLGRTQQRVLLARLLVDAGRVVSVDRLIDDLWEADPPAGAADSLQALVSRLRRVLEPDRRPRDHAAVLLTRAPGYAVEVGDRLDATRFTTEAAAAATALGTGRVEEARELLETALGRWRGDVLADMRDRRFVAPVAARLCQVRTSARADHAVALAVTGDLPVAIAALEALADEDPWREQTWQCLAVALHRDGRTAEALARLREVRRRLADEHGLDPGARLVAVETSLIRGEEPPGVLPAAAAARSGPRARPAGRATVASSAATRTRPVPDEPVVGRLRELALLDEAMEHVAAGGTRVVALVGEPGAGKTRLAEHATAHAGALGGCVAWGRAHEDRAMPALWPWLQVLRALDVPRAEHLLGASTGGDQVADRFDRCDRVGRALADAATERPVLVVLDDLQWADGASLGLLDLLAGQLRNVAVGIVLTVRTTNPDPAVDRVVADVTRRPGGLRIELAGLDAAATRALAARISGEDVSDDEAARMLERTGGNPYFVAEFSRLGVGDGTLDHVPDGVRDVLRRRLLPLGPGTLDLLGTAAVSGLEFDADLLAAATGRSRPDVAAALAAAVDARIVRRSPDRPAAYEFAHALVRDVLRDDLADLVRRRHHLALAAALEDRAVADPERWLPQRAGHLVAAAPLSDGVETTGQCVAAARLAAARLAHDEAVTWHTRALQSLDGDGRRTGDLGRRAALLGDLGIALGDAGDHQRALAVLAEAIDAAEAVADVAAMGCAARAFDRAGGFWFWVEQYTRPTQLIDRLDRTLAALGTTDSAERVRVLVVRAVGEYYGDAEHGMAVAAEAREIADRLGDPLLVADAIVGQLSIGWRPDRTAAQRQLADDLLLRARTLGARQHELLALTHQFVGAMARGDIGAAETWHTAALELARDQRQVLTAMQLEWSLAMFAGLRGDLPAAHRIAAAAEATHRRTGFYALDRAVGQTIGMLCWEQGTLSDLAADRRAFVLAGFPEARVAEAHRRGDLTMARRLLGELVARPMPPSYESVGLRLAQARLAADLHDHPAARALEPMLTPYEDHFGDMGTVGCTGPVRLQLARMASMRGDHDRAVTLLDRCIEELARTHLPVWRLRADEALAAALQRRDAAGDGDRARAIAAGLDETARSLQVALTPRCAREQVRP